MPLGGAVAVVGGALAGAGTIATGGIAVVSSLVLTGAYLWYAKSVKVVEPEVFKNEDLVNPNEQTIAELKKLHLLYQDAQKQAIQKGYHYPLKRIEGTQTFSPPSCERKGSIHTFSGVTPLGLPCILSCNFDNGKAYFAINYDKDPRNSDDAFKGHRAITIDGNPLYPYLKGVCEPPRICKQKDEDVLTMDDGAFSKFCDILKSHHGIIIPEVIDKKDPNKEIKITLETGTVIVKRQKNTEQHSAKE